MLSSVVARGPDIIAGGSDLVSLGFGVCGGAGFDFADVTSGRLELFAVFAGAGAEGTSTCLQKAKGSGIIALGSGGAGWSLSIFSRDKATSFCLASLAF